MDTLDIDSPRWQTDHQQDPVLQWPRGLDGLLLLGVTVLPGHTLLDHHTGFWELVFIVEEEVTRLQVLHRCSSTKKNKKPQRIVTSEERISTCLLSYPGREESP